MLGEILVIPWTRGKNSRIDGGHPLRKVLEWTVIEKALELLIGVDAC